MRARLGPYRVDRLLGEGGMGVVYAGFDERLQRAIALKTLRAEQVEPSARERLWREARAAASVSHPNVCQVFDVGEEGGDLYIAMELLAGEPLSARLARGPLSTEETRDIGLAVLGALDALHTRGLVHRDLKPSNVFLTPHGVKLVDFGLAIGSPASDDATLSRLTRTGTVVGTPHYMAPEQIRGESVDERADLFALGAVLVEMATGRPPFEGRTTIDVLHAVLFGEPRLPGGPAAALAPVAARALARDRDGRYATARAMALALRDLASGPTGERMPDRAPLRTLLTRLIVLPFRLLRTDPEIDFLGFGLADAITNALAGVGSLIIRSSLTAARYAEGTPDLAAIAREADVDVVLAGTLLRAGSQLRVSAQLVEVPNGTVLWSEQLPVALEDVFQLQDDLARQIVSRLEVPLTAREDRLMRRDVPAGPRAYEWYLRGVRLGTGPTTWREARDLLQRCVATDPNYAPAWARLGRLERLLAKYALEIGVGDRARAEAAFQRALALNPDLSLAHTGYAALEVELGRPVDAMVRLLRLAADRPTDATLFAGLVHACRYCGLLEASIAAQVRARLLEPGIHTSVGHTWVLLGQYRHAREDNDQPLDASSSIVLALLGLEAEAIEETRREEARMNEGTLTLFTRALRHVLLGDAAAAWADLDRLERSAFADPEGWFYIALLITRLGDHQRAIGVLTRVVRAGYAIARTLRENAWLSPLRPYPEYAALIAEAEALTARAHDAFVAAGGPQVLMVPAGPRAPVGA